MSLRSNYPEKVTIFSSLLSFSSPLCFSLSLSFFLSIYLSIYFALSFFYFLPCIHAVFLLSTEVEKASGEISVFFSVGKRTNSSSWSRYQMLAVEFVSSVLFSSVFFSFFFLFVYTFVVIAESHSIFCTIGFLSVFDSAHCSEGCLVARSVCWLVGRSVGRSGGQSSCQTDVPSVGL